MVEDRGLNFSPFLNYLKFEKRFSPNTIRSYSDDLGQFSHFLMQKFDNPSPGSISSAMIRSWMVDLSELKMLPRSINRKLSALKSFFKFQLREGNIQQNPAIVVRVLKTSKRLPSFDEKRETSKIFRNSEIPETWKGRTDNIILHILYGAGLRLSELINLKENQVDNYHRSLRVLGKGNKERIIPISQELLDLIRSYKEAKKKELEKSPDHVYLLVSEKGKKLYSKYVYLAVKEYLADVTSSAKKSPHVLRHTFATHLTNNGADLNAVKELLGHSSLAATQIYTHNSIEQLRDIHRKAHPKA